MKKVFNGASICKRINGQKKSGFSSKFWGTRLVGTSYMLMEQIMEAAD
jgi:hypothetical protein